jgi:hypothetical protein
MPAIVHMSCTLPLAEHSDCQSDELAEGQMNIKFVYTATIEIINLSAGKVRGFTRCDANEIRLENGRRIKL